jgi:hypothetical protein
MNIRSNALIALTGALVLSAVAVVAEESGEGPYNPGQTADFIDTMPGFPSLAYMNVFTYYGGSAGANQQIPISGMLALNLKAASYSDSSVLVWETPLKVFGGYYNIFASIPYTWLTVSGDVQKNGATVHSSDTVNGIGDIYFSPATIGWTNGDFKWDGRFGIYAPSGGFDKTSLANAGLGYWSFEPEVTFSWFSSKIGTEFSVFAGVDFNTENPNTSYTSGDIFHIDFTLAQHLPMPLLGANRRRPGGVLHPQNRQDRARH